MTDRLTDLLDELADDGARPLGFTAADLAARGGVVRRRRRVATVVSVVAAAAAVAVVWSVATDDESHRAERAVDVATEAPSDPASVAPTPSAEDLRVAARCTEVDPSLSGWTLDAQLTDEEGTTATFVSADETRWRTCTLGAPADEVSRPWPLSTAWDSPDTIIAGGGVSFAELCPKDSPPDCSRRLYDTVQPLWDGVASVEVTTPQGSTVEAVTGRSTYVVRFVEPGVPESLPGIEATLRDADGAVVLAYDFNELMR